MPSAFQGPDGTDLNVKDCWVMRLERQTAQGVKSLLPECEDLSSDLWS